MMSSRTEPRKKRFQVYSLAEAGNPLFIDSFDLREQAQRRIDQMIDAYDDTLHAYGARRPRLTLVDAKEATMELMS